MWNKCKVCNKDTKTLPVGFVLVLREWFLFLLLCPLLLLFEQNCVLCFEETHRVGQAPVRNQ